MSMSGPMPDEFDRIDTSELSHEERAEIGHELWNGEGGMSHLSALRRAANAGEVSRTPRTITSTYTGDSPAAALGRAYNLRDDLRAAGVACDARLTGTVYELGKSEYDDLYEFELVIEGGE